MEGYTDTTYQQDYSQVGVGALNEPPQDKKRKLEMTSSGVSETEVRRLLAPLKHEQCVDMLVEIATQYPSVYETIREIANKDISRRKIFVRQLSFDTTSETLNDIFSAFGEVEEAVVIKDRVTNKSKGFGFVTFKDAEATERALAEPTKMIDGRSAHCNLAAEKQMSGGAPSSSGPRFNGGMGMSMGGGAEDLRLRKLFVRQLSFNTTSESLRQHFKVYGDVQEAVVLTEPGSGKSKGYGFVTMATAEGAARALVQAQKEIDGRLTHTKLAAEGQTKPSMGAIGGAAPFSTNVGNFNMGMNPMMAAQQFSGLNVSGNQNMWGQPAPAKDALSQQMLASQYGQPAQQPKYGAPGAGVSQGFPSYL